MHKRREENSMIEDKKQISTYQPKTLVTRLDKYLMKQFKETGRLHNRTEFITEAITEKLDKEEER